MDPAPSPARTSAAAARWTRELPRIRRAGLGLGTALLGTALLAAAGCVRAPAATIPVSCDERAYPAGAASRSVSSAADTVDLIVTLDSVPSGPGSVRVRVDPLADSPLARLSTPPPTAVAAGMALEPPGRFVGCAAEAPPAIELRGADAPLRKAWVMVASDRPVRVTLAVADRSAPQAIVLPGASAIVSWE